MFSTYFKIHPNNFWDKYYIAEFLIDKSVEVVPRTWINQNGTKAYWPLTPNPVSLQKSAPEPNSFTKVNWNDDLSIRILHHNKGYADYSSAHKSLQKHSENLSDWCTETEEAALEKTSRRSRSKKRDNDENWVPPIKKPKQLSRPPVITLKSGTGVLKSNNGNLPNVEKSHDLDPTDLDNSLFPSFDHGEDLLFPDLQNFLTDNGNKDHNNIVISPLRQGTEFNEYGNESSCATESPVRNSHGVSYQNSRRTSSVDKYGNQSSCATESPVRNAQGVSYQNSRRTSTVDKYGNESSSATESQVRNSQGMSHQNSRRTSTVVQYASGCSPTTKENYLELSGTPPSAHVSLKNSRQTSTVVQSGNGPSNAERQQQLLVIPAEQRSLQVRVPNPTPSITVSRDVLQQILSNQQMILNKLGQLDARVAVMANVCGSSGSSAPEGWPSEFPLNTFQAYQKWENFLQQADEPAKLYTLNFLMMIGGKEPKEMTRKCLSKIIGDNLRVQLNMDGSERKTGIKKDKTVSVIIDAARERFKHDVALRKDVNEAVLFPVMSKWLRQTVNNKKQKLPNELMN